MSGFDRRLLMRSAALQSGAPTHGLDYDDTHMSGFVHLGVRMLPTPLAWIGGRGMSLSIASGQFIEDCGEGIRPADGHKGRKGPVLTNRALRWQVSWRTTRA